MTCESFPPPLRAVAPVLQRRPHVTRRSATQGSGRSIAAPSWSSTPTSRAQAPSSGSSTHQRKPRPKCYYGDEMPLPSPLPTPSASFEIVSAMPEDLQSAAAEETSLDLPAWVENTNRHTLQDGGGVVDEELVPWMQMPQPEVFSGVTKEQYRETAIYSEPGTPGLSRAYATNEVKCPQPRPPIVSWATFGFYTDSETPIWLQKGAFASSEVDDRSSYYGDASEEEKASVSSRLSSPLSIKCKGHNMLKTVPSTVAQPPAQEVDGFGRPRSLRAEFMDWAEDGSSGRSSPCYSEGAYEEYATPLAPARARIIHISGDCSQFPTRSTSLFQADSCEPSPTWATTDEAVSPNLHPTARDSNQGPPNYRSKPLPKPFPRPFTPYYNKDIFIHTPPMTPINLMQPPTRPPPAAPTPPTPPLDIQSSSTARLRQRKHIWGSNASEMSSEIVNDIYAATRGSSIKKLTLEYPCVIVIRSARRRWRTYDGWYTNPTPHGRLDSLSTSMFLSSADQSRVPSPLSNLSLPSEVGSKDTENEAVWSQGEVTGTATPMTDLDSEAEEPERLTEADFGSLRRIFPKSNAKWYGILYAHLVCYNYIMDLDQGPSFQHLEDGNVEAAEGGEHGFIVENLQNCISRIICRMRRKNGRRAAKNAGNELRETHLLLIRSLSTFVRSCEASIMA